jgi:hypothetical protein
MKKLEVHPASALASRLKHIFNIGTLFEPAQRIEHTDDRYTVKILTSDGRTLVQDAVQLCLTNGIKPRCTTGREGKHGDQEIHGLNHIDYEDLVSKLELIPWNNGVSRFTKMP